MPRGRSSGARPRSWRALALWTASWLAAMGCASSAPSTPGTTSGPAGSAATATTKDAGPARPIERFTGADADFYVPPDPLPPGAPGAVIRAMRVGDESGFVTEKVMYHSRDALDRDRAVTALVTYPTAAPPEGGWPVIATAPGTTGIAAQCGITHRIAAAPDWGVPGVRVITDYLGLGVVGGPPHPYLGKASEGHSLIDAVRAVHNLAETGASDRWLSIGHSQGGHGALSAHELSATYAPELHLVATLALAPAAMLDKVYGGIDPIVTAILTVMSLYGGAGERPSIVVDDFVTPELAAAAGVLETGCLDEIVDALVPLALEGKLFLKDPRRVEPTRGMVAENEVGDTPVAAPVFLVSGTRDDRVVLDRVLDLYARMCAAGQVTEVLIIEGADHGSILPVTAARTSAWLAARLAGEPATNSCTHEGATTSRA